MPALQRNTLVRRGPRFWEVDGDTMFENVLDGSTRDGPRRATPEDEARFVEAYEDFLSRPDDEGLPAKPLISAENPDVIPPPPERPHAARRDRGRDD